jgi:branched-chain amino acid transport system substrate-binding protein
MLFNHKNTKYLHHITNGVLSMKRNAKTIIAGIVALSMSHAAMAKDIKVAVVGAMSGPVAQWGDMEFNGARQAIKDINARAASKATSWWRGI